MPGNEQALPAQIGEQWSLVVLGEQGEVVRLTGISAKSGAEMDAKLLALPVPINVTFAVAHINLFEMLTPEQCAEMESGGAGAFAAVESGVAR